MKILAASPLHYGSEYLPYALQGVKPCVDHTVVFYSSRPTYGHAGILPNPDSKERLSKICDEYGAEFLDITHLNISQENAHRDLFFRYARKNDYDIIVAFDYDEVWDNLNEVLDHVKKGTAFQYGIRGSQWYHFWRSFNEVNRDGFSPIRVFNMHGKAQTEELIELGTIYHFGYAISEKLMRYKISCHGHKNEFPRTWLYDKWINYERGVTRFLHPATNAYWIETESFDAYKLPKFMTGHPLFPHDAYKLGF